MRWKSLHFNFISFQLVFFLLRVVIAKIDMCLETNKSDRMFAACDKFGSNFSSLLHFKWQTNNVLQSTHSNNRMLNGKSKRKKGKNEQSSSGGNAVALNYVTCSSRERTEKEFCENYMRQKLITSCARYDYVLSPAMRFSHILFKSFLSHTRTV